MAPKPIRIGVVAYDLEIANLYDLQKGAIFTSILLVY
jgi:hypothetical protein